MRHLVILAVTLVSGCGTLADVYPNSTTVLIDGSEYMVRKVTPNGNDYQAAKNVTPLTPAALIEGPASNIANVKAIETVTGCPIERLSIEHGDGFTRAAVACPANSSPKF